MEPFREGGEEDVLRSHAAGNIGITRFGLNLPANGCKAVDREPGEGSPGKSKAAER